MGLRMEDLHTPTVAAGPTSGRSSNGAAKDGLPLTELIAEKERVESELLALGSVLESASYEDHGATPLSCADPTCSVCSTAST